MVEVVFQNGYKTKLNKTIAERLHAKGQILWPDEVEKIRHHKKKDSRKDDEKKREQYRQERIIKERRERKKLVAVHRQKVW